METLELKQPEVKKVAFKPFYRSGHRGAYYKIISPTSAIAVYSHGNLQISFYPIYSKLWVCEYTQETTQEAFEAAFNETLNKLKQ